MRTTVCAVNMSSSDKEDDTQRPNKKSRRVQVLKSGSDEDGELSANSYSDGNGTDDECSDDAGGEDLMAAGDGFVVGQGDISDQEEEPTAEDEALINDESDESNEGIEDDAGVYHQNEQNEPEQEGSFSEQMDELRTLFRRSGVTPDGVDKGRGGNEQAAGCRGRKGQQILDGWLCPADPVEEQGIRASARVRESTQACPPRNNIGHYQDAVFPNGSNVCNTEATTTNNALPSAHNTPEHDNGGSQHGMWGDDLPNDYEGGLNPDELDSIWDFGQGCRGDCQPNDEGQKQFTGEHGIEFCEPVCPYLTMNEVDNKVVISDIEFFPVTFAPFQRQPSPTLEHVRNAFATPIPACVLNGMRVPHKSDRSCLATLEVVLRHEGDALQRVFDVIKRQYPSNNAADKEEQVCQIGLLKQYRAAVENCKRAGITITTPAVA